MVVNCGCVGAKDADTGVNRDSLFPCEALSGPRLSTMVVAYMISEITAHKYTGRRSIWSVLPCEAQVLLGGVSM